MNKILEIGSVLHVDENGFLVPEADRSKIKPKWNAAVLFLVNEYLGKLGDDNVHSIWVRGSVAKGQAIENISDIDSFCLINKNNVGEFSLERSNKIAIEKFPFVAGIEMELIPLKSLFDDNYFWWRFALKIQSVCVYGEDISNDISGFRPDKELAKIIQENLEKRITEAKNEIEKSTENKHRIQACCSWIMKRIVRQGFILTMSEERTFTRDLYPCYYTFSKYYPEKEEKMRDALELAIFPSSNKNRIFSILDDFGGWLISESKNRLD